MPRGAGIRHDAYANAHRIPVVVQKPAVGRGKYLHPELYGTPGSLSVVRLPVHRQGELGETTSEACEHLEFGQCARRARTRHLLRN